MLVSAAEFEPDDAAQAHDAVMRQVMELEVPRGVVRSHNWTPCS